LLSFVRVATPFDSLFGATEIAVGGLLAATQHLATYVDFDGVAYIIAGNTNGLIGAVRSRDRGDTWSDYRWTALAFSSANANFAHTRAVPVRGGCLLVHSHEASTDTHEDSVHAAWLGGWNRMSQNESGDGASPGYDEVEIQRYGLGLDLANALQAALTWVPFEIPSNTGWASVGAGSFTLASGAGNFVSAA
ncbi:MAG: hypothetical protein GTO22_21420, partial [Gemmatimonadales bacterium]|nr:hypothetical protein [Gemmatimonadales bacterium]NIN12663.1 hypothetical protein [Gemmatimonadales bacterium]